MRRLSLRWMLLIPIVTTITVGFIAFACFVDASERSQRLDEIDRELSRAELTPLSAFVPIDPNAPLEQDDPVSTPPLGPTGAAELSDDALPVQLVVTSGGELLAQRGGTNPFSTETLTQLATEPFGSTLSTDGYRVLVSPENDELTRITALSLSSFDSAIMSLRQRLLVGGIVIVMLEATIVWGVAGRLSRPLTETTAAVSRIAAGELDTVIKPSNGSRETAELTADLGRMVDHLRTAIAAREQSTSDATQARDDMRRLLADVSHEIRTPLTALKGYADLYAQGMLSGSEALDRAMSRVGDESIRLNELVTSMMRLARDGSPLPVEQKCVDLAVLSRNVVDDLRVAFPSRNIESQLPPAHTALVTGNPNRLHQAMLNLGGNACTHTAVDSVILIAVKQDQDAETVTVSVVDHGPGVDVGERNKIFLPFYRSDPSRTRVHHDGTGLGLAVTQQIAAEHQGSVTVHETPGGGATFELELPLAKASHAH
ncbi:HAMP domain-containing sensor histidine kinase [Microbacterium sp. NPDC076911]|uniref:sensor histidine kinase n=1 Tax=Microbacterium sp. NPDC076911 TaxID=3154958 RepID=UPI00342BF0A8